MIFILGTKVTPRKHWLTLITVLLGLSISLIGCSSLTTSLSNQSTRTTAAPTTTDKTMPSDTTTPTDNTIPSVTAPTDKTNPSVKATPVDTTNETQTTGHATSQSPKTPPTAVAEKKNTVSISKAKYNQLKYGDTFEKIKSLLGGTGEVVTESGTNGSKSYTVTYLCHVKSPSGGEVFLAFKDNKLVNIMEVNLQ